MLPRPKCTIPAKREAFMRASRLARELGMSRKPLHTLAQRVQTNLNNTAPTELMAGTTFEADELYQRTRGKNSTPQRDPTDPPRRRATQRNGHGTSANARPPSIRVMARETGEQRLGVCDHADRRTCADLIAENVPADSSILYTDAWQSYRGRHPTHATVYHGVHEWAQDDDGDGQREVHGHTCEGAGVALRTYLRAFRGVHKPYLHL
jgi:transposase-like protein